MKTRNWIIGWFAMVGVMLVVIGVLVIYVDPFFHYHKPHTDQFYYTLNNQRSQNDGIVKHFDYDALITGTSMTENFKASELNELFGVDAIKVCYSGSTYKETGDTLRVALEYNPELKLVVRGLHPLKFIDDKDATRDDLGNYPTYLYDDNPFNDVYYLFNRSVIFGRTYEMIVQRLRDGKTGITSFDDYSYWEDDYTVGIHSVAPDGVSYAGAGDAVHLTEEERDIIRGNITQNVTSIADDYPEVEFYYFIPPLSILYWKSDVESGNIDRQLEAEQCVIELLLQHDNIKLFSFNTDTQLVTDLNNYIDEHHYAPWVNTYILQCMHDGQYQLTKDNYRQYLADECEFYQNYDYLSLNEQVDYEDDSKAADILLNRRVSQ